MAAGRKTGGRKKGTPNKATLEKERVAAEIAARTMADATTSGKKLAKEVLEDFMELFAGMAAHYQPAPPGKEHLKPSGNEAQFLKYADLTVAAAAKLAPYQSPTFKAVAVSMTPGDNSNRPGDGAKIINMPTDSKSLQRLYTQMVKSKARA